MYEQIIEERLIENYNDDLQAGLTSEALAYAIDENPEIILDILKTQDDNEVLDLVAKLKAASLDMFKEQNYDSVSRLVIDSDKWD